MKRSSIVVVMGCFLVSALWACGGEGLWVGESGIVVTAKLSAVALSSDCAQTSSAKPAPGQGDLAPCPLGMECPSFCQQSNMTLDLTAGAGTGDVAVKIVAVRVINEGSSSFHDELTSREPTAWNQATQGYIAWDERLDASQTLSAQYKLSAPDWNALVRPAADDRNASGGDTYRVEVDLLIDGVQRTITLGGVTREPEIAT